MPPTSSPDSASPPDSANVSVVEVIPGGPVQGSVRPPGSKSLTNRALVCAAFAQGNSIITGALRSEDTEVMVEAMRSIGVTIEASEGGKKLAVDTSNRQQLNKDSDCKSLFIANSGTTIRFLTAALSAAAGHYRLHGVARMHERPIADLVDAIAPVQQGSIETESENGCPPVLIQSDGWSDGQLSVAGSVSSQYLSGLMMAAPIARANQSQTSEPTIVCVNGELVSRPYVDMTAFVMRSFGADVRVVEVPDETTSLRLEITGGNYQGKEYSIEPDASAASYFWATAAITGGDVTVEGLSRDAMQGDVGFCQVLEQMGCTVHYAADSIRVVGRATKAVDVDMNAISDTVQTLAVVALFVEGKTRVRGVAHNRFKETDRIGDLATELRKLGAIIDEHEDGLSITPPSQLSGATLETYHDHRMAMSLSLAGLQIPGVRILNPACTGKTYPDFFADLERLTGRSHRWASS